MRASRSVRSVLGLLGPDEQRRLAVRLAVTVGAHGLVVAQRAVRQALVHRVALALVGVLTHLVLPAKIQCRQ